MHTKNKQQKTKTSTLMVRILFFLHGKCIDNPNIHNFKIDILELDYFPMAFTKTEDFNLNQYTQILDTVKENPIRLIHLLNIKETGYYELVGNLNCTFLYDNDEIVDNGVWKITQPMILQLSEDEVNFLNQKK